MYSPNFKMSLFKRLLMNPRDVIFHIGNKMEISSSKEIYHPSFKRYGMIPIMMVLNYKNMWDQNLQMKPHIIC